ncbi:ankyrin repeat domain-containing protein 10-like isoform X3 [Ostrea edulis]|uniref:ankyrin repeat domain-containing protein 10-like isoform X3 n=1 Tax=Ostrea edulis TaxID=37623 RepID=UPI002094CFE3|nr:ankyrin repeat domain-containing protein 10-like isoform X3 [Ostrea edulis]
MEHQSEGVTWSMTTEELFLRHFPLHQACRNGDLEKLSALLASGNAEFYEEDSFYGWSPLHWAANFGKLACLRKLSSLSQYGSDNPSSKFQQSPLHMASCTGHPHCTQWLIQSGANLNRQDYLGDTPIHKAAKKGNMECVSLLVSQGASLSLLNHSHCTPSQSAAENGHLECAQYIENAGKLQGQLDRNQCVTMQPSHLLQSQMEHDMSGMPCLNGHSSDGASPVDDGMDMSGDSPMIGVKRGRDEYCDEESFKRMRKGVQAQNELDTDINNVIVSYQAILALSTEPLKCEDSAHLVSKSDFQIHCGI